MKKINILVARKYIHSTSSALNGRLPLLNRISHSPTFPIKLPLFHCNIYSAFSPAFSIQYPVFSCVFTKISSFHPAHFLDTPKWHYPTLLEIDLLVGNVCFGVKSTHPLENSFTKRIMQFFQ